MKLVVPNSAQSVVFAAVAIIFSSVLLFGILELVFRLADPVGRAELGLLVGVRPDSKYEEDETLGYKPRDPLYFWDDKERPPLMGEPSDTIRVFALGDSFTKAHGRIGKQNAFYRQVQRCVQAQVKVKNFEFFHFGVSGYCEKQFLELLKRFGPRYKPDMAVLQAYLGNDVGENSGLIMRGLALVRTGKMAGQRFIVDKVNDSTDVSADQGHLFWNRVSPSHWSYFYRYLSLRLTIFKNRFATFVKNSPEGPHGSGKTTRPEVLTGINTGSHFISLMKKKPPSSITRAWQKTEHLIGEIAAEGERQGIVLVFVLVPHELQVNRKAWAAATAILRLDPDEYDTDLPSRRFMSILLANGIAGIDLTERFRQIIDSGGDLYNGHFNRGGHDETARTVCQGIHRMDWLPNTLIPHGYYRSKPSTSGGGPG